MKVNPSVYVCVFLEQRVFYYTKFPKTAKNGDGKMEY
jgi:hypothetical protein